MRPNVKPLHFLILLLFAAICLTACDPPAEIIVPCNVNDLIGAINDANANSDTTKIILEPNCTYPFTVKDNSDGGQGPNALPQITTKIIIEGNNATLDRTGTMFRFFFITVSGNLRLEDITLENGYALITTGVQPNTRGGAIYNDGGGLRAERSIFRLNNANNGEGGAIFNLGILTLEDSIFELNFSDYGGAIYNGGSFNIDNIVENVTFDFNVASQNGGAIYNVSSEAGYSIIGSTFVENHSYFHGGAIYTESADLNITSSEFIDNVAGRSTTFDPDWGNGGAIYTQSSDVFIFQSLFDHQRANNFGGAIYAGPGSDIKLREVMSDTNGACHGGGALYVEGETEILQSTLKNNYVGGWTGWDFGDVSFYNECDDAHGGAIINYGSLIIDSSLLQSNWAREGDSDGIYNINDLIAVNSTFHYDISFNNIENFYQGINNLGNAELNFSTFVHNSLVNSGNMIVKDVVVAGESNGCDNSGTLTALGENAAVDPACPFSLIFPSFSDLVIQNVLSDNGGPTLTNFVGNVSPLIDKSDCLSASGSQVINDQRGVQRPYPISGTHDCDIGALETYYDPSSPPPPPIPPTQVQEHSPGCDPFEGEEISHIVLNMPASTRNLPISLRILEGIFPGFDPGNNFSNDYSAKLGETLAYQISQQGFPERVYFMFKIPEGMENTFQPFSVWLPDCPDPVFEIPGIQIPFPIADDPDTPICKVDLVSPECEAAGGHMSSGVTTKPRCICP